MTKHTLTYKDANWRAIQMGNEGWAVFAGAKMIASNLSEAIARLIAAVPDLLDAAMEVIDSSNYGETADFIKARKALLKAIRKAEEQIR